MVNGWQTKSYVRKLDRMKELLLLGMDHREIEAVLEVERGCRTHKSEVSYARYFLRREGKMELGKRCRVTVDGVEYPSISAAARAQKPPISRQTAHKRLGSEDFKNWKRLP